MKFFGLTQIIFLMRSDPYPYATVTRRTMENATPEEEVTAIREVKGMDTAQPLATWRVEAVTTVTAQPAVEKKCHRMR